MQALILAGGKGTRLRPLTVYTPKPIVPVLNRPFLWYQLEILKRAGITDVTLSLSYQPDKIVQVLGNGGDYGVNLRYITEPNPLGTGGAYRFAADALTETTVVLNGDILTDIDIAEVVNFHRERSSAATLALVPVVDPSRYGLVKIDGQNRIKSFVEKPRPDQVQRRGPNMVNAGIYVLEPEILALVARETDQSFEYDVFPAILAGKLPFFGCPLNQRYWIDIGTPQRYLQAHHDFLDGRISGFEPSEASSPDVATHAEIDRRSVIGAGCMIKAGARIINSVIAAGVHIEEQAIVENSVVWGHTRIAAAAEVRDSIVGRSCHIGRKAMVGPSSVLGDKTVLTDYTSV